MSASPAQAVSRTHRSAGTVLYRVAKGAGPGEVRFRSARPTCDVPPRLQQCPDAQEQEDGRKVCVGGNRRTRGGKRRALEVGSREGSGEQWFCRAGLGPNTCGEGSGGAVVLAADEKRRPGIRPAHPPRAGEASAGRESCSGAKSSPKMWGEPRSSTKGGRPMCGQGGSQFPVWVSTSGQRQAGGERRRQRCERRLEAGRRRSRLRKARPGWAGPGGGGVRCRS